MTILYTNSYDVNQSLKAYLDDRFSFLSAVEGVKPKAYYDTQGIAHIGIGFNLTTYFSDYASIMLSGVSSQVYLDLQNIMNAKKGETVLVHKYGQSTTTPYTLKNNDNLETALSEVLGRTFGFSEGTDPRVKQVFDTIAGNPGDVNTSASQSKEGDVTKFLSDFGITNMPLYSRERLALFSLAYNQRSGSNALLNTGLGNALASGDRAEAWYEIRYNSNKDGEHTARRYAESTIFGLYNNADNITADDALDAYEMYTRHPDIKAKDDTDATNLTLDNAKKYVAVTRVSATVADLRDSLLGAANTLNQQYGEGTTFDTFNIEVAKNSGQTTHVISSIDGDYLMIAKGDGETLNGGKGNDVLWASGSNDNLNGGGGVDTFVIDLADTAPGTVTINADTDNTAASNIMLGTAQLQAVGSQMTSKNHWTDSNGRTYIFDDSTGKLNISGGELSGAIVIENFDLGKAQSDEGYLGIHLQSTLGMVVGTLGNFLQQMLTLSSNAFANDSTSMLNQGAKTFTVGLDAPVENPLTVTVTLSGGVSGAYEYDIGMGPQVIQGNSFTLTIPAGLPGVSFSLISTQPDTSVDTVSMSATFSDGSGSISSNSMTVNVAAGSSSSTPTLPDGSAHQLTEHSTSTTADPISGMLVKSFDGWEKTGTDANGDPVYTLYSGDVVVNGVSGYENNVNLTGGNNVLNAATSSDTLAVSGSGNNIINAMAGDIIAATGNGTAGAGANQINITGTDPHTNAWTPVMLGGGNNTVTGAAGEKIAVGGVAMSIQNTSSDGISVTSMDNTGVSGNNTIIGNKATMVVALGDGNNAIYSDTQGSNIGQMIQTAHGDSVTGQNGNLLVVGNGNNTIVGGGGNDFIAVGSGNNIVVLGNGNDTFFGGVTSTDGQIPLGLRTDWSATNQNGIIGENFGVPGTTTAVTSNYEGWVDQNANTQAGYGNATIYGGTGSSVIDLSNGNNYVDAGGGNDTINGGMGSDTIYGSTGNVTVIGGGGDTYINGESGNDLLIGQGGNNTIFGGSGRDTIYAGGVGVDTVTTWANQETGNNFVYGGSGNVQILGSGGNDTLVAGSGNSSIWGGKGNEDIEAGGDGNDSMVGGTGNTTIIGGGGSDTIFGSQGTGTSLIYAGDGGTASASTLVYAGKGASTIFGGMGVDQIYGGAGTALIYAGDGGTADAATTVTASTGHVTVYGGDGYDVLDAGTYGSGGNLLTAGAGTTTLVGGSNDTLVAGSGDNTVFNNGATIDVFNEGFGTVQVNNDGGSADLQFGSGFTVDDLDATVDVAGNLLLDAAGGGSITVIGGAVGGIASIDLGGASMSLADFLQQIDAPSTTLASAGGDTQFSTGAGSYLQGGLGNDLVSGWGGNDTLQAGTGNTTLVGGGGNDLLLGSSGTNIFSASGLDTLVGGSGTNTYKVYSNNAVIEAGAGNIANDMVQSYVNYQMTDSSSQTHLQVMGNNLVGTANSLDVLLEAKGNNDTLVGGTGHDTLKAGTGNAVLQAGFGDTTMVAGSGNVLMVGGFNNNTFVVNDSSKDAIIAQFEANNTVQSSVDWTAQNPITSLEFTGSSNLTGHGNSMVLTMTANDGNDTLYAGSAANAQQTLVGGAGSDVLVAGDLGEDVLMGGSGSTRFVLDNTFAGSADIESGSGGGVVELDMDSSTLTVAAVTGNDGTPALLLTDTVTGGVIQIDSAFANNTISYAFSNGISLTLRQLLAQVATSTTSNVNDAGNIVGFTDQAATSITGGSGNDTLMAFGAQDTMVAGAGTELLEDFSGGNTFQIGSGGLVTVETAQATGSETIQLAAGTALSNYQGLQAGNDLLLKSATTEIVVKDFFSATGVDWEIVDSNGQQSLATWWQSQPGNSISVEQEAFEQQLHDAYNPIINTTTTLANDFNTSGVTDVGSSISTVNVLAGYKYVPTYSQADLGPASGGGSTTVESMDQFLQQLENNGAAGVQLPPGTSYGFDGSNISFTPPQLDLFATSVTYTKVPVYVSKDEYTIQDVTGGAEDNYVVGPGDFYGVVNVGDGNNFVDMGAATPSYWIPSGLTDPIPIGDTPTGKPGVYIEAGSGNDTLIGSDGNDVLVGGEGVNLLAGGSGSDIYLVSMDGNSQTTIVDEEFNQDGNPVLQNTIKFGSGVTAAQLSYQWSGAEDFYQNGMIASNTGVLTITNGNSSVDIYYGSFFDNSHIERPGISYLGVQNFQFTDGTSLSLADFLQQITHSNVNTINQPYSLSGDISTIYGSWENDVITDDGENNSWLYGAQGDDTLTGSTFHDYLSGDSGNDSLVGSGGYDTLDGGSGNDTLSGGGQNDTYIFGYGYAHDTIVNASLTDTIQLASGVSLSDVRLAAGSNGTMVLTLARSHGNDTLTFDPSQVQQITFADGGVGNQGEAYATIALDSQGDITMSFYQWNDSLGVYELTGTTWKNADGTSGSTGYSTVVDDGNGNVTTKMYSTSGVLLSDCWVKADGSYGTDFFNADGSSSGNSVDASGNSSSYSLTATGNGNKWITFTNGDSETLTYTGYVVVEDDKSFATGGYLNRTYNSNGVLISDTWQQADGTSGADTYAADGSSTGTVNYLYGNYGVITNDGHGNVLTNIYSPTNLLLADQWSSADGSSGSDQYNANGSLAQSIVTDPTGFTNTNHYLNGVITSDNWRATDGSYGTDTFLANGSSSGVSHDAAGNLVSSYLADGYSNLVTTTYYNQGVVTEVLTTDGVNDTITGGIGDNLLVGGAGDNLIDGSAGNDTLQGGAGNNTASYDSAAGGVAVNLSDSNAQNTGSAGMDKLINIQNLVGTAYNDTLSGDGGNNILDGDGSGNDQLTGGAGDDTLIGGSGSDTLDGGTGNNTASYVYADSGVAVNLSTTTAQDTGGAGVDTLTNIQNLVGSAYNDTLTGDAGNNILEGGGGDDYIDGGAGNNTASYASASSGVTVDLSITGAQDTGGAGVDTLVNIQNLTGSAHDDVLKGDAGNNILDGGAGNDTLYGGGGTDTFVFGAGYGQDVIADANASDVIQVNAAATDVVFSKNSSGQMVLSLTDGQGNLTGDTLTFDPTTVHDVQFAGSNTLWDVNSVAPPTGMNITIASNLSAFTNGSSGNLDGFILPMEQIVGQLLTSESWGVSAVQALSGLNNPYNSADPNDPNGLFNGGFYYGQLFGDMVFATLAQSAGTVAQLQYTAEQYSVDGSGNVTLFGPSYTGDFTVNYQGSDTLTGSAGADFFDGMDAANLVIDGGLGNDTIQGGNGADTVIHRTGDGNDVLSMYKGDGQGSLVLIGNGNNGPGDVQFVQDHYALKIIFNGETITVNDYFHTSSGGIWVRHGELASIRLFNSMADYNTWLSDPQNQHALQVNAWTPGGGTDAVSGVSTTALWQDGSIEEHLATTEGNDTITTGSSVGNLTLNGQGGNDYLAVSDGNNTIIGGTGNDTLVGGGGSDTYQFARGDGVDTVQAAGQGEMQYAADIASNQLWFQQSGNDLVVSIIGTSDSETISNWYVNAANQVGEFVAGDGKVLLAGQVDNLVSAMASFAVPSSGQTSFTDLPSGEQSTLAPVLAANWT